MADILIVSLSLEQAAMVKEALEHARFEVLVGVDLLDRAFKLKIDGGVWSPPMGVQVGGP